MVKFFLSLILSLSIIFTNVYAQENENVEPKIYGESYVVLDGDTNEIILGKNVDLKMYPASTTKLITAILLAEHKKPSDTLVFTQGAKKMPEYSVNLNYFPMKIGQELSADFVMKSILIFSANDMAQVVADNLSQELNKPFEQIMNDKLKELGIKNTNFKNAVGLHNEEHYSTAYDLARLLKEALKYSWIEEVIGTKETTVTLPDGSLVIYENSNKLLGTEGMIGGKTGYTSRAGRTLVGAYEFDGKRYFITVLKSIYDSEDKFVFQDMHNLSTIGRKTEKTLLYKSGTVYPDPIIIEYKLFGFFGPKRIAETHAILKDDIYIYDNQYNKDNLKTEIILKDNINIFTSKNKPVGVLKVSISDYVKSYDITVDIFDVISNSIFIYIAIFVIVFLMVGIIIFLITKIMRSKRNKRIWK